MADWASLGEAVDLVSFGSHLADVEEAAAALVDFDVLCLMRERMALPGARFMLLLSLAIERLGVCHFGWFLGKSAQVRVVDGG